MNKLNILNYSDDTIDLFNLNLPNLKEIISDILQKDNIDTFVILNNELRSYRQIIFKKKYYKFVNDIKILKKQWKWIIKQNLKSDSCKILRIILWNSYLLHGTFIYCLKKSSNKMSKTQKHLISDCIIWSHKNYLNHNTIYKQYYPLIESKITKMSTMDEILEINKTTQFYTQDKFKLYKSTAGSNFKLLQDSSRVYCSSKKLKHTYFNYLKEFIFLVY